LNIIVGSISVIALAFGISTSAVSAIPVARVGFMEYTQIVRSSGIVGATAHSEATARAELITPLLFTLTREGALESTIAGGDQLRDHLKLEKVPVQVPQDQGEFLGKLLAKLKPAMTADELKPKDSQGRLYLLVVMPSGMGCAPCDEIRSLLITYLTTHPGNAALIVEFDFGMAAGF
jgi:hypothetical protein